MCRTSITSLDNKLLWSDFRVTAALLVGREHESDALAHYKKQHSDYSVQETGLWLNTKNPTPGCRYPLTNYMKKGLVEIKCPYVSSNCNSLSFIDNFTTKQCRGFCCVKNTQGNLRLKTNHKYHFQIQMQLALYELDFDNQGHLRLKINHKY